MMSAGDTTSPPTTGIMVTTSQSERPPDDGPFGGWRWLWREVRADLSYWWTMRAGHRLRDALSLVGDVVSRGGAIVGAWLRYHRERLRSGP